jgi:hypothetical protein
MHKQDSAH